MRSPPLPGVLFICILKWKPIHGAPLTHGCSWEKEIVIIINEVVEKKAFTDCTRVHFKRKSCDTISKGEVFPHFARE